MKLALAFFLLSAAAVVADNTHTNTNTKLMDHYLVGLLNYPNSAIPEALAGITTGTYTGSTPYEYVPSVGFSDIEFTYDETGKVVVGEYWCLADNGFGSPTNSADYPLHINKMKIQKPFTYRHGESTFEKYTETISKQISFLTDPMELIKWENGADIVVTYTTPDETWDDLKDRRVLTGRDFDPEGLAIISKNCAIMGDELMPGIVAFDPETGIIKSPFVRTPDLVNITKTAKKPNNKANGKNNKVTKTTKLGLSKTRFLSTTGDKVHCPDLDDLASCTAVDRAVVEANPDYRLVDRSGGYEGLAKMPDGSVIGMLEKNNGITTLQDEPGFRTYRIDPGNCDDKMPKFTEFLGFYKPEINGNKVSEISPVPGSNNRMVVMERNDFPPFVPNTQNHMWPALAQPHFKLCIIDMNSKDSKMVFNKKVCMLNFIKVSDPYDVDGNGIDYYAFIQLGPESLLVVDDYCFLAGQDTNFPTVNQFGLEESQVPDWEEVNDTRFFIACFVEPVFNKDYPLF